MKTKNLILAVCVLLTLNFFAQTSKQPIRLNTDLIITTKGDSIRCAADRRGSDHIIYYHYARHGHDPKGKISAAEVIGIGTAPLGYKNKGKYSRMNKGNGGVVVAGVVFVTLIAILVVGKLSSSGFGLSFNIM